MNYENPAQLNQKSTLTFHIRLNAFSNFEVDLSRGKLSSHSTFLYPFSWIQSTGNQSKTLTQPYRRRGKVNTPHFCLIMSYYNQQQAPVAYPPPPTSYPPAPPMAKPYYPPQVQGPYVVPPPVAYPMKDEVPPPPKRRGSGFCRGWLYFGLTYK
ncbi:hypothetical protein J1N35_031268 [Gossypium stocksii]|uniref:Uncharacterized protein n=1 Tax=Gossypium stocksii TaxID=47602 RepID=A0A9D3V1L7_9ROSI|nr:hypothetical protein J1N35_031268 [Gossypium stocksii]